MTVHEWAAELNPAEYRWIPTHEQIQRAKADGVVIARGYSDDLLELDGAISEEFPAGQRAHFDGEGLAVPDHECDCERCRERVGAGKPWVAARWTIEGLMKVDVDPDLPHARFVIVENGTRYGSGVVFALADARILVDERRGKAKSHGN
jgi:hypothetical protein